MRGCGQNIQEHHPTRRCRGKSPRHGSTVVVPVVGSCNGTKKTDTTTTTMTATTTTKPNTKLMSASATSNTNTSTGTSTAKGSGRMFSHGVSASPKKRRTTIVIDTRMLQNSNYGHNFNHHRQNNHQRGLREGEGLSSVPNSPGVLSVPPPRRKSEPFVYPMSPQDFFCEAEGEEVTPRTKSRRGSATRRGSRKRTVQHSADAIARQLPGLLPLDDDYDDDDDDDDKNVVDIVKEKNVRKNKSKYDPGHNKKNGTRNSILSPSSSSNAIEKLRGGCRKHDTKATTTSRTTRTTTLMKTDTIANHNTDSACTTTKPTTVTKTVPASGKGAAATAVQVVERDTLSDSFRLRIYQRQLEKIRRSLADV